MYVKLTYYFIIMLSVPSFLDLLRLDLFHVYFQFFEGYRIDDLFKSLKYKACDSCSCSDFSVYRVDTVYKSQRTTLGTSKPGSDGSVYCILTM